jgi:hypothetical protein
MCYMLVPWNRKHLANANKFGHICSINGLLGWRQPALVTPQQLLQQDDENESGMKVAVSKLSVGTVGSNERIIVALLCILAAAHTFIFSAAFPFFNNVDEQTHFDLVTRYSNGDIPRILDPPHEEAMPYLAIFNTPEFLWAPDSYPDGKIPPPPWTLSEEAVGLHVLAVEKAWRKIPNHEASQPPLYYSLAGMWWRLAKAGGFHDGFLLYGLRFLNVFFVVLLVWLGYLAARMVFPEHPFMRLGVPALLAFIPQTAFYSVNNDVLLPVCFGAAFVCLLKFSRAETPGMLLGAVTGLTLAATYLTKISGLPLLFVSAAVVAFKIIQLCGTGKWRAAFPSLLLMAICSALPIGLWLAWTKHNFGDFTGTAEKIQILGWTRRPFVERWHHPIFSPRGFGTFISGLLATFWRGEFVWHGKPLASTAVDLLYVLSSALFVGIASLSLLPGLAVASKSQRHALWIAAACVAAAISFVGFLSIIYDFHNSYYPSREHPYFTSGRLMLGALIPFLLLYLYGVDRALNRVKQKWVRPFLLALFILFMLGSEIAIDWPIFPNSYNWFHM